MFDSGNIMRNPFGRLYTTASEVFMSSAFRLSIISHVAAIAVGAFTTTAYLTVYSASRQSLADYISAICTKAFGSAPAAETPYLAENIGAMTKIISSLATFRTIA
jgi:hypothetical protein